MQEWISYIGCIIVADEIGSGGTGNDADWCEMAIACIEV